MNTCFPWWLKVPQLALRRAKRKFDAVRAVNIAGNLKYYKQILDCDYLIAGHDGAFNEYDCKIIELMQQYGMKFGLFGTSLNPTLKNKALIGVYKDTLKQAEFVYCRNRFAVEWGQRVFNGEVSLQLCPDPAFGMRLADDSAVNRIIETEGLKEFFKRPVILITTCEPAPIARHCFTNCFSPKAKIVEHRRFLAEFFKYIVDTYGVNLFFMPHAIGPGPFLDDRVVARDVLKRIRLGADRVRVLETEYSGRELKALLRRGDLLVAERIHSIIGAVGVHIPILCLGSKTDRRVDGIVGSMLRSDDLIYYLNSPVMDELKTKFNVIWGNQKNIAKRFEGLNTEFHITLERAAKEIRVSITR